MNEGLGELRVSKTLFYIEHFEKSMVYAKTIGKKSSDNESTVNKI